MATNSALIMAFIRTMILVATANQIIWSTSLQVCALPTAPPERMFVEPVRLGMETLLPVAMVNNNLNQVNVITIFHTWKL